MSITIFSYFQYLLLIIPYVHNVYSILYQYLLLDLHLLQGISEGTQKLFQTSIR